MLFTIHLPRMDFCNNSKFIQIVFILTGLFLSTTNVQAQNASQVLERSIHYHDPYGYWDHFRGQLEITTKMPNSSDRHSLIRIDRQSGLFKMEVEKDDVVIERSVENNTCMVLLNGSDSYTEQQREAYGLTCERNKMYRNYYTYLYGMPMKIKDEGANLDPLAEKVQFMGKEYWRLRVTYDADVGSDIWYFYFDTKNYALEAYQFYHDEKANDGEYILLSEEVKYKGMRVPKIRKWYMNANDKYLGVDILNAIASF